MTQPVCRMLGIHLTLLTCSAVSVDTFGSEVNSVDGNTTEGAAQAGEAIGQSELAIGRSAETMTGAQDSYSHGGAHST